MTDLRELPHIGPKLSADLVAVGIPDAETLLELGADEASRRLAEAGLRHCPNSRRAVRAAVASMAPSAPPP